MQGQRAQAIEGLLNLEKSSRLAEDVTATKACCSAILELCYDARDWRGLEENVMLLTKRRSQLKQVRRWPKGHNERVCRGYKGPVGG